MIYITIENELTHSKKRIQSGFKIFVGHFTAPLNLDTYS